MAITKTRTINGNGENLVVLQFTTGVTELEVAKLLDNTVVLQNGAAQLRFRLTPETRKIYDFLAANLTAV